MKRFKKTLALFAAALLCILPILDQPITAQAEEPITYYLKYLEDMQEWRYQQLTAWDENNHHGQLNHVLGHIKDGDTIVINGDVPLTLELSVRLKNLTILNADTVIVSANGIDEYYQHDGVCVLNSEVKTAYVHGNSVCNFNKNVTDLSILGENDINAYIGAIGTVGHVIGKDNHKVYYEAYSFVKDTLRIEDGSLRTEAKHYSTTAPSAPAVTTPPAAGNANDYDAVPKTGESSMAILLAGMAAVCLFGSYKLRRN